MGFLGRNPKHDQSDAGTATAERPAVEPTAHDASPAAASPAIHVDRAPNEMPAEPQAEPQPAQETLPAEQPQVAEPLNEQPQAAVAEPEVVTEPAPQAAAVTEPAVSDEPAPDAAVRTSPPPAPSKERFRPDDLVAPERAKKPAGRGKPKKDKTKTSTVIAFANQKGGVAKTTTTLNLGVAFAELGYRVLCVDMDPQGNLTMSQGIDPDKIETSMYDVLVHHIPILDIVAEREIDIAVSSIDLAGAEIAMSTQIGRERSLQKALSAVEDVYDFVCIDTPPSLGLLTINALTAASKVIVPVQCEYLSMRGLVQLQNTLEMIRENLNPGVEIEGILPTMLDARTVHAKEAVEILEENFGDMVFKTRIRKAIKFAEAPVRGSSVLKYDSAGNAAGYYRELAEEVLARGKA